MILLHPLLAWGLAAVSVPILIHLLLRQRPRPRPWAAMRWLLAAHRQASRRWRLTNLLLLALRCLAVALLALAVARLALPGLGAGGGHLVLVIDRSASMGARDGDPGPLAEAQAAIAAAALPYERWTVVAVAAASRRGPEGTEIIADGGREAALAAIARLAALPLPGGLDGADAGVLAEAAETGADALLISDFQQDDGGRAAARLAPCRRIARWAVGRPSPNRWIAAAPRADELRPGEAGELRLGLGGLAGSVRIGIDGSVPVVAAERASGELRLPLPPLSEGIHRLQVALDAGGLAYDDALEVPLRVQPPLPVLIVAERSDYAAAALLADDVGLRAERVRPGAFPGAALPPGGVVLLRAPVVDAQRLAAWVRGGGVLWCSLDLLASEPALAPLAGGATRSAEAVEGGPYATGEPDIDEVLSAARRDRLPKVVLPAAARRLLSAGVSPAVVALDSGAGAVVIELDDLAGDAVLAGRGTVPLWVVRTARRLAAQAALPAVWTAGQRAPATATLMRDGAAVAVTAGEMLAVAPGVWMQGAIPVVVLPSPEEARIGSSPPASAAATLAQALPADAGGDFGRWLLLAALLVAAAELLIAAWAGRRYGG